MEINGAKVITAYHRPKTLEEALALIKRPHPRTLPLGGGTLLSHLQTDLFEVVDLQALDLGEIKKSGNYLHIGSTATLQQLFENPQCPDAMRTALRLEAPLNLRNAATVAGALVVGDGRSSFAAAMLALDATLIIQPDDQDLPLGDFMPLRDSQLTGKLITRIQIPLNAKLAFENVSRTPMDKPIVSAALAQWPSGRTRLVVGGYGKAPILAMDGTEPDGLKAAARNALQDAGDQMASSEYRQEIADNLANRCLTKLNPAAKQEYP
jgi:CO/xanthine dehydrogenase FAD-binding subunit